MCNCNSSIPEKEKWEPGTDPENEWSVRCVCCGEKSVYWAESYSDLAIIEKEKGWTKKDGYNVCPCCSTASFIWGFIPFWQSASGLPYIFIKER